MSFRTLTVLSVSALIALASGGAHAATSSRGVDANLSNAQGSAILHAQEGSDPLTGSATSSALLKLTIGNDTQTISCEWSMPDDPVVMGAATLQAMCAPYAVTASFTATQDGFDGTFPLVCGATINRLASAAMTVSRDGTTVLAGNTTDARVWRALDLGTC